MKLIFERSGTGRTNCYLPPLDVPATSLSQEHQRQELPPLPQVGESEVSRHYQALASETFGICDGFYPLGSCTMKYNPKFNEEMAALSGFTQIHPLQPKHTTEGCQQVIALADRYFSLITGMDKMTFQPAAGAHGELTGLMLIKAYHQSKGDTERKIMLVPDSAHGTNPATASMVGYTIRSIPSTPEGRVDLAALEASLDETVAGLMLTNPNTLGIFETDILEMTRLIHGVGGQVYYDGANLNAIMGVARPGDMGFDVCHLNLHKTFSTPHGGGGPGCGAVGCKSHLIPFLPYSHLGEEGTPESIGQVKGFYGNFGVTLRALCYLLTLGGEGVREGAQMAVCNANYMKKKLVEGGFTPSHEGLCMHEFVLCLEDLKKEYGVSALDMAKSMLDAGMHPPTMYFPLIVHEALMLEPTETETPETLDEACQVLLDLLAQAKENPEPLKASPTTTYIGRPDETQAARKPVVCFCQ